MPLRADWVDALFARLSIRYGVAFSAQYRDLDPAAVKADWAEVLSGLSGEAIAHGLRCLPEDRPPNAMQFRRLCYIARPPVFGRALPAPMPNIQKIRELVAHLRGAK